MLESFFKAVRPAAIAAIAALAQGCAAPPAGPHPTGVKLLLVAMDGLEWRVALPLVQAGQLPTFEKLMREGMYGKLETLTPTASAMIWTSVATGKLPAKHGILGNMLEDADGNEIRTFNSTDRTTKAVWNIYSDYGRRVHCIGWWKTYPVEEISGVMVAQMNTLFSFDGVQTGVFRGLDKARQLKQVHPAGLKDSVISDVEAVTENLDRIEESVFGRSGQPPTELGARLWEKIHWVVALDTIHHRIAENLLRSGNPFDLTMVYFRGADVISHNFWRFAFPETFRNPPTAAELAELGGLLPSYYRRLDALLASLLEASGPGTTVLVLSDHGMEPKNRNSSWDLTGEHRALLSGGHGTAPPSLLLAAGPGVAPGPGAGLHLEDLTYEGIPLIGRVYDVAPTLLELSGLPAGEDMDGEILKAVLDSKFLAANPPTFVASHDEPGWREHLATFQPSEEEERDRLEELRSLGYIE